MEQCSDEILKSPPPAPHLLAYDAIYGMVNCWEPHTGRTNDVIYGPVKCHAHLIYWRTMSSRVLYAIQRPKFIPRGNFSDLSYHLRQLGMIKNSVRDSEKWYIAVLKFQNIPGLLPGPAEGAYSAPSDSPTASRTSRAPRNPRLRARLLISSW